MNHDDFLVAVAVRGAVVVSADSRIAIDPRPESTRPASGLTAGLAHRPSDPDELLAYTDSGVKLAILGGQIIAGMAGASAVSDVALAFPTAEQVREAEATFTKDPALNARSVATELIGNNGGQVRSLLFAVVTPDGHPRVLFVDQGAMQRLNEQQGRAHYGVFPIGFDDVVQRLVVPERLNFTAMTVQQAADLSRFLIQATIAMHGFEVRPRLVGGPIVTAVVDREGARWITPPPPIEARDLIDLPAVAAG